MSRDPFGTPPARKPMMNQPKGADYSGTKGSKAPSDKGYQSALFGGSGSSPTGAKEDATGSMSGPATPASRY